MAKRKMTARGARMPAAGPGERYVPGVCNIDAPARRKRAAFGLLMLALTLALWYCLRFVLGAGLILESVLFIPALLAFIGFWQAKLRFCMGDARKRIYEIGGVGTVADEAFARRDAERARQIFFYATVSAIVLTLVLMLL
ncbi:MAG: hypothetical protein KGH63_01625 [Candidatus Micrarchaeota archaeon]|nr:hypothetical protein [Candidatus Micrarchaeota archaeon]